MTDLTNAPILDGTGQNIVDKLDLIASRIKSTAGGGGGGGTTDYTDLDNKPSIEGITLSGNKTAADLGLQNELQIDNTPTQDSNGVPKSGGVYNAIANATETVTVSQASADFEEIFGAVQGRVNNMYSYANAQTINGADITYEED